MVLRSTPHSPWRALIGLALIVLSIHLWLLQARPGPLSLAFHGAPQALVTRVIEIRPRAALQSPLDAPQRVEPEVSVAAAPADAMPPTDLRNRNPRSDDPPLLVQQAAAPTTPVQATEAHGPDAANPPPQEARAAPAFAIPGSVRLRYVVTGESRRQPYRATGLLSWSHDGTTYEARMEVGALLLGARRQVSTGRITAEGVTPSRFADEARNSLATHFRHEAGVISFSNNAPDVPLVRGAQDRLSVLLQLGSLIAGSPASYTQGSTISIQTAGTRDADAWVFVVGEPQILQLPGGELAALKLERTPRRDFDQKVEVWLAPTMDYLPVRVRLTQPGGDYVDQQWEATDRS